MYHKDGFIKWLFSSFSGSEVFLFFPLYLITANFCSLCISYRISSTLKSVVHYALSQFGLCSVVSSSLHPCILYVVVGLMQDPLEPVLLFTRPVVPEKLAAAGIVPPPDCSTKEEVVSTPANKFRGRIGRGGRLIFDRWNPLMHTPIDCGNSFYIPPKPRPATYN